MPDNGTYLLTSIGFSPDERPILLLQTTDTFLDFYPLAQSFTLSFDMSQRFCVGWRDITTGERFVCPNSQPIDAKYEQCSACQKRTGFNPAFYHATSVSPQQEARNAEPHMLYIAQFGPGVIKVGISHAKRGHARLLEQGARTAIILDEVASAHIARQYEARIAALPEFSETVQLRKKTDLLAKPYDHAAAADELRTAQAHIESSLNITFRDAKLRTFDDIYFPHVKIDVSAAHNNTKNAHISGTCIGLLGSILFCEQADANVYVVMKKYVGYNLTLSDTVVQIDLPAQQTSLF